MDDKIIAAIIAAAISIVGVGVNWVLSNRRLKIERRKLITERQSPFAEKVYQLRLDNYGEAFDITEYLRPGSRGFKQENLDAMVDKLEQWRSGQVYLILGYESLEAYRELIGDLKRKPGTGDQYTEQQIEKIVGSKVKFRRALKQDLGVVYSETLWRGIK